MTLEELVAAALAEDIGTGDLTTRAVVAPELRGRGVLDARQPLVVSGLEPAAVAFRLRGVDFRAHVADGDSIQAGSVVAEVEGPVIGLQHHKGALVFAGGESGLVVLRGANGAPLQATSLGSRAINAPSLAGDHLALVSASGHLYSFELGAPPYNLR